VEKFHFDDTQDTSRQGLSKQLKCADNNTITGKARCLHIFTLSRTTTDLVKW